MTKLDDLIKTREGIEEQLQRLETIDTILPQDQMMERLRSMLQSLRWAEKIVRAALVIAEERTPEGVSETLIDELVKACR